MYYYFFKSTPFFLNVIIKYSKVVYWVPTYIFIFNVYDNIKIHNSKPRYPRSTNSQSFFLNSLLEIIYLIY